MAGVHMLLAGSIGNNIMMCGRGWVLPWHSSPLHVETVKSAVVTLYTLCVVTI